MILAQHTQFVYAFVEQMSSDTLFSLENEIENEINYIYNCIMQNFSRNSEIL